MPWLGYPTPITHYYKKAPEPCKVAAEYTGEAVTGAAAISSTAISGVMLFSAMTPLSMFRSPLGGAAYSLSLMARTAGYGFYFLGKLCDTLFAAGVASYYTAMYKHLPSEQRDKFPLARVYLTRHMPDLTEGEWQQFFGTILSRYNNVSWSPSDNSKSLVRRITDESSYPQKMFQLLAYLQDTDEKGKIVNLGRNLFTIVCEEIISLYERAKARLELEGNKEGEGVAEKGAHLDDTLAPWQCALTGRMMVMPVLIPTEQPYNGDGRIYCLLSLLEHCEANPDHKLLGALRENMQIDLDKLQHVRSAQIAVYDYLEFLCKQSPKVAFDKNGEVVGLATPTQSLRACQPGSP